MTHKKEETTPEVGIKEMPKPPDKFEVAVGMVTAAAAKFIGAGVGGKDAIDAAVQLYRDVHGHAK